MPGRVCTASLIGHSTPDPADETWVYTHLLQTVVAKFNTPGWGPSTMTDAAMKKVSAMALDVTPTSALIRPVNDWHPAAYVDGVPPSQPWPGSPLWPERCQYTAPTSGDVAIQSIVDACSTTPYDSPNTRFEGGRALDTTVAVAAGETSTLAELLQRASGPTGITWFYTCSHASVQPEPVDPGLGFSPSEACLLTVTDFGRQDRDQGRRVVETSELWRGPSNCPALAQP